MKKLFRIFALLLAFVPCALMLTACGNDYDRAKNEASFKEAVEKTGELGDNYTITTTSSQTGLFAEETVSVASAENDETVIKVNGGNFSILEGTDVSYSINGITYTPNGDGSYSVSEMQGNQMISFDLTEISEETMNKLIDFAFRTNPEAIKVDGEDVKINLEFSQYLNTLIRIIGETEASENNSIADLINNILAHYEITLPVGEFDPDNQQGQIENFLDRLDGMTIQDVCDYIETNTGVEVVASIKTLFATIQLSMVEDSDFVASAHTSTSLSVQYATSDMSMETINEMLALPLSDVVEMVLLTIDPTIDLGDATVFEIAKDFITNNSLSLLIASSMSEEETPSLMEIAQAKQMLQTLSSYISFNKINLEFTLDFEGEDFVGASVKFTLEIVAMDEIMSGEMKFDFEFSNVGSTVVEIPQFTTSTPVDAMSTVVINSSMISEGTIVLQNFENAILSTFFANGIEVLADDGETSLIKIEKETGVNTFKVTISDEIISELYAQDSTYNLVKVTTEVGNNELTLCFVVDVAPVVE